MRNELIEDLKEFVSTQLVSDSNVQIQSETPLLEYGILTSLNITRLLSHIRANHSVDIPPEELLGDNLKDIESIVRLVDRLCQDRT